MTSQDFVARFWLGNWAIKGLCANCAGMDRWMYAGPVHAYLSNKQFPSRAPWLTLASRRQCEAHTKHSQARQNGTVQPLPATFKWDFCENHDPTKFKQNTAFSPETVLYHLGHLFNVLWKSREPVFLLLASRFPDQKAVPPLSDSLRIHGYRSFSGAPNLEMTAPGPNSQYNSLRGG